MLRGPCLVNEVTPAWDFSQPREKESLLGFGLQRGGTLSASRDPWLELPSDKTLPRPNSLRRRRLVKTGGRPFPTPPVLSPAAGRELLDIDSLSANPRTHRATSFGYPRDRGPHSRSGADEHRGPSSKGVPEQGNRSIGKDERTERRDGPRGARLARRGNQSVSEIPLETGSAVKVIYQDAEKPDI